MTDSHPSKTRPYAVHDAVRLVMSLPNPDDVVRRYVADALLSEIDRLHAALMELHTRRADEPSARCEADYSTASGRYRCAKPQGHAEPCGPPQPSNVDLLKRARNLLIDAQNFIGPTTVWRDEELMLRLIRQFIDDTRGALTKTGATND